MARHPNQTVQSIHIPMSFAMRVFNLIRKFQALEVELRSQLAEALAAEPDADEAVAAEAAAHAAADRLQVPDSVLERLETAPNDAMAQLEALEAYVSSLGHSAG
jgi:hypothetical protein